jgi:hypothetical protein
MPSTLRTISRGVDLIITVVTLKRIIPKMIRERHAAIGALKGKPTFRAEDEMGKPPSIEKEETLFFISPIFLKGLL